MNVRYRVTLTQYERNELRALLNGGKSPARKLKRAQILLAADAGVSDEDIALSVGVGGSSVYRTKRRFVEGNLERALGEEPRPGAERKLTRKEEALLVATACSNPPAGRARWTLELLAGEMVKLTAHESLSRETVRRREGHHERVPELVADLVRRRVAVIATPGDTSAALAAKAATSTISIVFGVGQDPVKLGLVASLARPGGNATGVNFFIAELAAKRLGLLREMVPHTARVAALLNPANAANAEATLQDLQTGSRATGLQIRVLNASSRGEIDAAFAMLAREKLDALFVSGDGFFNSRRVQLALLAVRYAVPAIYSLRDYPEVGGLMSYGTLFPDVHHQVGVYTGQILKGAKPADLPVLQPTKFELVINTQAASLINLEVPPTLLARADEVIE